MLRFRFLFLPLLAALAGEAAGADWREEVYVWQRQWTPAVNVSLQAIDGGVAVVHVLSAEVTFRAGRLEIFRAKPDYAVLKTLRAQVGLVIRIGAFSGPFSAEDAVAAGLASLVAEQLKIAREAELAVVELQLDFDCAESRLGGYRAWLRALRVAAGSMRLVFTALPAWLKHAEAFAALAREADGFVLQVHSLEKPANVRAPLVLCDPMRVRRWVEQAGGLGSPFRVALPTYGYEAAFDAEGYFVGIAAEGLRRSWKAGTQLREVRADEIAMGELAHELRANRPAGCEGVIWFRLPVEGDRHNWSMRALAAIMRGERPRAELRVSVVRAEEGRGVAEVVVENTGDVAQALPARVGVSWSVGARALAADGLGGYRLELRTGAVGAAFSLRGPLRREALQPGRRVRIGWVRFSHETSLPSDFTTLITQR